MADPLRMRVNGPAIVRVAAQSAGSFPSQLGITSRDGARIQIIPFKRDVDTDASGDAPADVQDFNEVAMIRFRLTTWADDQLTYLLSTVVGSKVYAPGEMRPPGLLLGAAGAMKAIMIESPYGEAPYVFPTCELASQPREVNLGTERMAWEFTLRAIYGVGSNTDPAGLVSPANQVKLYYRP